MTQPEMDMKLEFIVSTSAAYVTYTAYLFPLTLRLAGAER